MIKTPGKIRQETALQRWKQDEKMAAILALEPRVLIVLQLAVEEENIDERWHAYTNLKQMGSLLVGWNSNNPALQTCWHYEVFIKALDECLPGPEDRQEEKVA